MKGTLRVVILAAALALSVAVTAWADEGTSFWEDLKSTGSELYQDAKEKAPEIYAAAKEGAGKAYDYVSEKAPEVYEDVKGRAPEIYDSAKEKAGQAAEAVQKFRQDQEDEFREWFMEQTGTGEKQATEVSPEQLPVVSEVVDTVEWIKENADTLSEAGVISAVASLEESNVAEAPSAAETALETESATASDTRPNDTEPPRPADSEPSRTEAATSSAELDQSPNELPLILGGMLLVMSFGFWVLVSRK